MEPLAGSGSDFFKARGCGSRCGNTGRSGPIRHARQPSDVRRKRPKTLKFRPLFDAPVVLKIPGLPKGRAGSIPAPGKHLTGIASCLGKPGTGRLCRSCGYAVLTPDFGSTSQRSTKHPSPSAAFSRPTPAPPSRRRPVCGNPRPTPQPRNGGCMVPEAPTGHATALTLSPLPGVSRSIGASANVRVGRGYTSCANPGGR